MRHNLRRVAAAAAVGLAMACASAPISKEGMVALAKADALVEEGCYDCLTEARDTYAHYAVAKARPLVIQRLFETTTLLALREKELARDPAQRFAEAKALVAELPPTYRANSYLDIADAVLPDSVGTPEKEYALIKRATAEQFNGWKKELEAGAGSQLFRQYLDAALDCNVSPVTPVRAGATPGSVAAPQKAAVPAGQMPPPPIVEYRRANCRIPNKPMLEGLLDGYPRFLEAGIFAGRVRSTTPTSIEIANARKWLAAGAQKFPDSAVPLYALGSLYQTVGDCKAALTFYDRTIALRPPHELAHLGRLVCLSYTRQHQPAIAEATSMIADRNNEGQAHYWRAWNYRETNKLPEARADSDRMKQILYNDRALTLAGQIEYDQSDLDIAEKDLQIAVKINEQNCIAAWYYALVPLKRESWTSTADRFVGAMRCYESNVLYDKSKLEEMRKAENVDETFRASQIAGFEQAIKDDSSQVSASALNAGINYARANNRAKALEYVDLAAKDPERAKQAEEIRALILKSGGGETAPIRRPEM